MKTRITLAIPLISILALFFIAPIPQWVEYHQFADQVGYLGIPNFFNVVSSLPYLLIGVYGLIIIRRATFDKPLPALYLIYIGYILIGVGSAYYHWSPSNASLVWDRLAMTIVFMSLFSFVISVFIKEDLGRRLLWPLLLFGLFSVFYWDYTEGMGEGDLRLYGLVQYLPMVLIPLILMMYGKQRKETKYFWYVVGIYALAKVTEVFDEQIMDVLVIISGHTLKHLISACVGLVLLKLVMFARYQKT